MIKISKQNNSLIVEGIDNVFYPNNGDNSYPLNSLIVVTDNSDMATFRSVATNDVLFSGLINNITINGEAVTKDNIIAKFDAVSNSSTGGGGSVDAYTKTESDAKYATKDELTAVETVANDADTKADAATSRIDGVETSLGNKQDTLVSGTNIKTINNQSILGEGNIEITGGDVDLTNYYTKTEADEIFATTTQVNHQAADISALQTDMRGKQATLVSGENIKTINSESILGSGDIQINGVSDEQAQEIAKIPTIEAELAQKANASDVPTVQTYYKGTNKNYVYSDGTIDNPSVANYGVISNMYRNDFNDKLMLSLKVWGKATPTKQVTLPAATTTAAGVMTAADKTKLDSIPETIPSQSEIDGIAANVSALETAMDGKQPTLVSGTNIKTINGNSILGEGNLVIEGGDIDLSNYYNKTEVDTKLDTKQNTLVSGTNIKTINSQSIIGSGDLTISGVSEEQAQEIAKIPTIETELAQKANASAVPTVQTKQTGGTDKNYIYSDYEHKNKLVFSKFVFRGNRTSFAMDAYPWGENENYVEFFKVPLATTTAAGVMSAADKTKLDSVPENIQPTLVSGTNIKTINGESVLGEGNIVIEGGGIDLSNYYNKTEVDTKLDTKQNTLISGTNIKTVNSQSILGEGNIEVTIPDATTATSGAMSAADKTKLDSISTEWTGTQSEFDALATKEDNIIYYVTE